MRFTNTHWFLASIFASSLSVAACSDNETTGGEEAQSAEVAPFDEEMTDEQIEARQPEVNKFIADVIEHMEDSEYQKADHDLKKVEPIKDRLGMWKGQIEQMRNEIDSELDQ